MKECIHMHIHSPIPRPYSSFSMLHINNMLKGLGNLSIYGDEATYIHTHKDIIMILAILNRLGMHKKFVFILINGIMGYYGKPSR